MIDHKAETERLLGSFMELSPTGAKKSSKLWPTDALAEAQVHASLYLADQQRIANLIALFSLSDVDAEDMKTCGVNWPVVALEIREGLGLA